MVMAINRLVRGEIRAERHAMLNARNGEVFEILLRLEMGR